MDRRCYGLVMPTLKEGLDEMRRAEISAENAIEIVIDFESIIEADTESDIDDTGVVFAFASLL